MSTVISGLTQDRTQGIELSSGNGVAAGTRAIFAARRATEVTSVTHIDTGTGTFSIQVVRNGGGPTTVYSQVAVASTRYTPPLSISLAAGDVLIVDISGGTSISFSIQGRETVRE